MSDEKHKSHEKKENNLDEEQNCHVTVEEGSYMTCDMIEEESSDEQKVEEDFVI